MMRYDLFRVSRRLNPKLLRVVLVTAGVALVVWPVRRALLRRSRSDVAGAVNEDGHVDASLRESERQRSHVDRRQHRVEYWPERRRVGRPAKPADSELSEVYDRYFAVVPARRPDLLDAAHALRYQVYCVEHAFEERSRQVGERERDRYDDHAVHAALIYKPTDDIVGCVRLILPEPSGAMSSLPMRNLLNEENRARLDRYDPARTAEISRYAVSKVFRRRKDEEFFPDVHLPDLPVNEVRRLVPYMSLGLVRGVSRLAAEEGITTVCAAMAPALLRLLERFGLIFQPLGPAIDYHGIRQPVIANCEALLEGMAARHAEYYELIEATYHGTDALRRR